jgi:Kef-type K+ transport system membrane component KefB
MAAMELTSLRQDDFALTLLGIAVVIVVAHWAGRLFTRFGQPAVIGEVVAGLLLGPSVLGHASKLLFPVESRPLLKILSMLGLIVFMFLMGLEVDARHFSRRLRRVAGAVAVSGIALPFGSGILVAFALYSSHGADTQFLPFALFLGAAMSVTAFPVLARILVDRKLYDTPLGMLVMACAAADDVLAWTILALVVAIVGSAGAWSVLQVFAMAAAFVGVMCLVVQPRLTRFANLSVDPGRLGPVIVGILVSSFVTSAIGIHEIFGAFLFGAVFPRGRLAQESRDRLQSIAVILLPLFFVTTGLNVDVNGLGVSAVWQFGLILAVACAGKLIGAVLGARTQGVALRESVGLGVLMNTRGLTELVVLSVGREQGVLDQSLYTLMVLMAVTTTLVTGPLLRRVKPDPWLGKPPREESDEPESVAQVPSSLVPIGKEL